MNLPLDCRMRHFCAPLHVAMKVGLYLHPSPVLKIEISKIKTGEGVWHVVSEGFCELHREDKHSLSK